MRKVAVLYGGQSVEREVSLNSGKAVHNALLEAGCQSVLIDVGVNVVEDIKKAAPEVAFIALHGTGGEDGAIQGLLETLGVPYTGSGILASAMAMNKVVTKTMIDAAGIPTAPYALCCAGEDVQAAAARIREKLAGKLVVKAPNQGSSIGIYFVEPEESLADAIKQALHYDSEILVEQFISGTEVTASIWGNSQPQVLPLLEIVSHTGTYDYQAKYTKGLSDHIIPARIPQASREAVEKFALKTYRVLYCRGLARVDFLIDSEGTAYVLEVNTIPGMTETSLFPDAARAAGFDFPQVVSRLVEMALE